MNIDKKMEGVFGDDATSGSYCVLHFCSLKMFSQLMRCKIVFLGTTFLQRTVVRGMHFPTIKFGPIVPSYKHETNLVVCVEVINIRSRVES